MLWFRSRSGRGFKARSSSRDTITDKAMIRSISDVIDAALVKAESEHAGLKERLDDVISRAALVGGNDVDDSLTRSDTQVAMLKRSDTDMEQGQARLEMLEDNISKFRSLRKEFEVRFPDA